MGDFEEMLGSILSSPKDMEKIMDLARELTGSGEGGEKAGERKQEPAAAPIPGLGDISPKMLGVIGKLMGELRSQGDGKAALVNSMKPYVRPERREALDRAVKIAKVARLARFAMTELGGELDLGI